MPEPFSPDQLNQLRQRWEKDPKSRAFLQLAEEYRRAGRLDDAIGVLQAGLREHPGYLSALVALGRCLLEAGDPEGAIRYLENAVVRDATQLVANKLLVEAFLARGDAEKARERLELYKLFNDRDTEIAGLDRRIRELSYPPASTSTEPAITPSSSHAIEPTPLAVEPPALFELPTVGELPALDLAPEMSPMASSDQPFGELYPPGAAGFLDTELARQGIFPLQAESGRAVAQAREVAEARAVETPLAPPAEATASELWSAGEPAPQSGEIASDAAWPEEPAALELPETFDEPAPELWIEAAPTAAASAPLLPPSEPAPSPSEPPLAASATLGELYLAQGHLDEAEESFRAVLTAKPEDPAARAGLESVRRQRGLESSAFEDTAIEPAAPPAPASGRSARQAALLRSYLERLRRGAKRHVS